mgnify:FL=1
MPPKNATQFFTPEIGGLFYPKWCLFILKHLQKPLYMLQST